MFDSMPVENFACAFSLIGLAELGDNTQIAVAGLASTSAPGPVWLGATLALILVSALGVWFGHTLLRRIPLPVLHRLTGAVFLVLALTALAYSLQLPGSTISSLAQIG